MLDSLYRLYLNKTFDLARSLVVKSEATAHAINSELVLMGVEVLEHSPHTWKYYLNLNGQYHTTDKLIRITSIDTLETIDFTKESLAVHKATKGLYEFGGSYYKSLVKNYPEQEALIRGVLNPVNLDRAVSSSDGSILTYESSLLEPQETNLMSELQEWIDGYFRRWFHTQYCEVDDLSSAVYLGILYANLPGKILSIRLNNCFTDRAHSYHIWTYLKGHFRLDRFKRSLTIKQALFLYRNIRYLREHAGKTETFDLLIERLLTERSIPIYGYDLRHNLEEQPEVITPIVEAVRFPLNKGLISPDSRDIYDVYELSDRTEHLARDNPIDKGIRAAKVEHDFKHARINKVHTKVIESVVVDTTAVEEVSLNDILHINWVTLACRNIYTGNLLIPNPHTGDVLQLNPKDAYVLYLYAYNISIGHPLTYIPEANVSKILKDPLPTVEELKSLVEKRFWYYDIEDHLLDVPRSNRIINNIDFYSYCERDYDLRVGLITWYKHHARLHGQAQLRQVFESLLYREKFVLSELETYDEWLRDKEIELTKISKTDAETLAKNIITAVTGLDDSEVLTPAIIQSDLIDIVDTLTSYDLQFVKTVIDSDAFFIDVNKFRLDNEHGSAGHHVFINVPMLTKFGTAYPAETIKVTVGTQNVSYGASVDAVNPITLPLEVNDSEIPPHYISRLPLSNLTVIERTT